MAVTTKQLRQYGKPIVFIALLLPALWLAHEWYYAYQGLPNALGWNPQETSHRLTGDWAIRIFLLSLAVTPLSKILKSPKPILFRRMIGLYAFFYVALHLVGYVWLDKFFAWPEIFADIKDRIFITVGFAAFALLIPLAVTSTNGWIRRLGAKNWQRLHKSVYAIGVLAVIHFVMMRKGFQPEPLIYGAILAALLLFRLVKLKPKRRAKSTSGSLNRA
jgi:sulfoxide reductase heme-binding subunit YedZ